MVKTSLRRIWAELIQSRTLSELLDHLPHSILQKTATLILAIWLLSPLYILICSELMNSSDTLWLRTLQSSIRHVLLLLFWTWRWHLNGLQGILTAIGVFLLMSVCLQLLGSGPLQDFFSLAAIVLAYLISSLFGNTMFYTSPFFFIMLGLSVASLKCDSAIFGRVSR